MQPLRGKVTSTDITTNSFKDVALNTPVVSDLGNGQALVMAVHKIFAQVAINDLIAGATGTGFVITGIGLDPFVDNNSFDLSKRAVIWVREIVAEQEGTTGTIFYEQITESTYNPPFLIASPVVHIGVENKQRAASNANFNVQIWYTLVRISSAELVGVLQ